MIKMRVTSMEVQQVREMCMSAGPSGYIAMSCVSLLRILAEADADDDDVLDVAVAGDVEIQREEEEEDPFA
jgi:hypothetical protein